MAEHPAVGEEERLSAALEDLRVHQIELELQNRELHVLTEALQDTVQQYRALYDRAPVGYLTLDQRGTVLRANLTAATLLGRERKALEGMSLATLVHPDDQDRFFLEVRRRLSRETSGHTELRIVNETGRPVWAGLHFSVEAVEDGYHARCALADLTERKEAEDALADSRDRLRRLAIRLQEVREIERKALAQDLHDGIGQTLAALGMDLAWVRAKLGPSSSDVVDTLGTMQGLVDELMERVGEQMVFLRPPDLDELGLSAVVGNSLAIIRRRQNLRVSSALTFTGTGLDPDLGTQVLRVFEGATSNVLRHADATSMRVSLEETGGCLVLEVEDDGRGITDEQVRGARSFGLMSMRERVISVGGTVVVAPGASAGTLVRAVFPLRREPD